MLARLAEESRIVIAPKDLEARVKEFEAEIVKSGQAANLQQFLDKSGVAPDVFRDHILACFITDPSGLDARHRIGMDIIAWECDYPHTDTTWPESPEFAWKEFQDSGCTDAEINQITWENTCRFFDWDPTD